MAKFTIVLAFAFVLALAGVDAATTCYSCEYMRYGECEGDSEFCDELLNSGDSYCGEYDADDLYDTVTCDYDCSKAKIDDSTVTMTIDMTKYGGVGTVSGTFDWVVYSRGCSDEDDEAGCAYNMNLFNNHFKESAEASDSTGALTVEADKFKGAGCTCEGDLCNGSATTQLSFVVAILMVAVYNMFA